MQGYKEILQQLKENKNFRSLPSDETLQLLDLCSNDYLGINAKEELKSEFYSFYGKHQSFSSCSSRLLSKSLEQHILLEEELAKSYQKESALLFNSGYHANIGIIPTLASSKDLVIADKLVHASIIDGSKVGKADFIRYKHLDYQHLERLLEKNRDSYNQVFIVSESIFSMDGDIADIKKLVNIKKKYNSLLYIDEAHALGVRGEKGLGCVEEQQCIEDVDFIVGTMGKAMASVGSFVVCKNIFKDYLINFSRPLIYSTALPPLNIAWSRFVFDKMQTMNKERIELKKLSSQFADMLNAISESHIIPYIIGSNEEAIKSSQLLKNNGFNVLPIRYPTVPANTARLRFSVCAHMSFDQLKIVGELIK